MSNINFDYRFSVINISEHWIAIITWLTLSFLCFIFGMIFFKLIKTNIDSQQTIYDDKILFLKSQATALRKTNQAKHIYLKFASMDDHRTIRTKWACVKNPRNTSPFQHDRKTGTIKQISSTITNCDLKMAPVDLRCFIAQNTAALRSHQRLPCVFWQLPDECRWTLNDFSLTPRRQGGLIQISIVSILKGDLWKRKKGCLKEMKAGELFKWK